MRQAITFAILILFSSKAFCQTEEIRITTLSDSVINHSGASKLKLITDTNEAVKYAFYDIENKTPFLVTNGGIAPSISIDQINFEEKYHVYYYRSGCSSPKKEIEGAYNYFVLDFIIKKYGKNGIDKISKDVFGLDDWKKLNYKN